MSNSIISINFWLLKWSSPSEYLPLTASTHILHSWMAGYSSDTPHDKIINDKPKSVYIISLFLYLPTVTLSTLSHSKFFPLLKFWYQPFLTPCFLLWLQLRSLFSLRILFLLLYIQSKDPLGFCTWFFWLHHISTKSDFLH